MENALRSQAPVTVTGSPGPATSNENDPQVAIQPHIPLEVMQKIFSRIPFPQIFKAKSLSKVWYSKLPSLNRVNSVDDHLGSAAAFSGSFWQSEVKRRSANWPRLAPVFLHRMKIIGFDQDAFSWREIPIHHKIPLHIFDSDDPLYVQFHGPIMFCAQPEDKPGRMLVANPITGEWMTLAGSAAHCEIHTICIFREQAEPHDYKILIPHAHWDDVGVIYMFTRLLDPRTKMWIATHSTHQTQMNNHDQDERFVSGFGVASAYLDGNVYLALSGPWGPLERLEMWKCNVANMTWTSTLLNVSFYKWSSLRTFGVYAAGSQLFLIILMPLDTLTEDAMMYRLDKETLMPVEDWSRPWKVADPMSEETFKVVAGPKSLFFLRRFLHLPDGCYYVELWEFDVIAATQTWPWRCIPLPEENIFTMGMENMSVGMFQPGIDPTP